METDESNVLLKYFPPTAGGIPEILRYRVCVFSRPKGSLEYVSAKGRSIQALPASRNVQIGRTDSRALVLGTKGEH